MQFQGPKKQINSVNYLAGAIAFTPFISRNLNPEKEFRPGIPVPSSEKLCGPEQTSIIPVNFCR
jgi:hypothetical protein